MTPMFCKKHTSVSRSEDTPKNRHGGVNTSCHITSQRAMPFVSPITEIIPSFLHGCVTYKDVMGLLEGEELQSYKDN